MWVPGCATGEEAYSIALVLREHMPELDVVARVLLEDESAEWLRRFFREDSGHMS